jgi:drug/metabolite transporter (DMT)-like permease
MTVTPAGLVLPLSGLLAMLAAALTAGESVILAKRVSGHHPAITNAVAMSVGATALLLVSLGVGEPWVVPSEPEVIWSVLYLVVFGSVGLFVLFLLVVRRWTASATAYAFVLFPVVTMLLEAWLVDEPLTLRGVSGAVIVMVAVWFGALAPSSDRLEPSGQPTEGAAPETAPAR